jgi:hypothetical protein
LVFHDIGLWTNNSLAFVNPSCDLAKKVLTEAKLGPRQLNLAHEIIYWNHKITPFNGTNHIKNNAIVEAARKADWVDITMGFVSYGMPKEHIQNVTKVIPYNKFQEIILLFGPRLRGWNLYAIVTELGSILRL